MDLEKIEKIYFAGIGGISMSALAKLMKAKNKLVCGADDNLSPITQKLEEIGIKVFKSHCEEEIKNCDLFVYTNALKKDNKNLVLAKKYHKTILERAEFLGEICKLYKTVIAVCGTHGKTTTTSMIAHILKDRNPTVHVGGIASDFDDNIWVGNGDIFITEACEYNKSFLKISPTHTVLTNIDCDHMDCYKDFNELKQTFLSFLRKTTKNVVFDNKILNFEDNIFANKHSFSFGVNNNSTYYATNITEKNGKYSFDVFLKQKFLTQISLNVFGRFNVLNALAAFALCHTLLMPAKTIKEKLETFKSTKRRFEILQNNNGLIITDYAHHPTEIKETIIATKNITKNNLICVFQPHTYSRTKNLFNEFLSAFNLCNKVIIFKTYSAREKPFMGKSGYALFRELKKRKSDVFYSASEKTLTKKLNKVKKVDDTILFLGAGNIDDYARTYAQSKQKIDWLLHKMVFFYWQDNKTSV